MVCACSILHGSFFIDDCLLQFTCFHTLQLLLSQSIMSHPFTLSMVEMSQALQPKNVRSLPAVCTQSQKLSKLAALCWFFLFCVWMRNAFICLIMFSNHVFTEISHIYVHRHSMVMVTSWEWYIFTSLSQRKPAPAGCDGAYSIHQQLFSPTQAILIISDNNNKTMWRMQANLNSNFFWWDQIKGIPHRHTFCSVFHSLTVFVLYRSGLSLSSSMCPLMIPSTLRSRSSEFIERRWRFIHFLAIPHYHILSKNSTLSLQSAPPILSLIKNSHCSYTGPIAVNPPQIWYVSYSASVSVSAMMKIFCCLTLLSNYLMNRTQRFCLMRRSKSSTSSFHWLQLYRDCMNKQDKILKVCHGILIRSHDLNLMKSESHRLWKLKMIWNTQFLSDYRIYCVLFGTHSTDHSTSICSVYTAYVHLFAYSYPSPWWSMEQSTCQSTEHIATLPKHF